MSVDEKLFIPHITECWAPAIVTSATTYNLIDPCDAATTDDLKIVKYDSAAAWLKLKALPTLMSLPAYDQSKTVMLPVVDPLEGKDNIADLQFVSEASVLHAIRVRYRKKHIYTDVGRIVIALNPFESRPDLYNDAAIMRYSKSDSPYTLPPHVYQLAAGAFKGMAEDNVNQSTLITGESGAGKTESTKLLLRFFAVLGGRLGQSKELSNVRKTTIEEKIVMANPILEAFGNASTSRNPNSSRFGKWMEILFDATNSIKGGSITSYMLEMPRVCEHLHSDRAYHIFYQTVAHKLGGTSGKTQDYYYLVPQPVPAGMTSKGHGKKVDDAGMYTELLQALKDYEFTANEQTGIFNLVSCILFLGNIKFQPATIKGGDGSQIPSSSNEDLNQAATLLGTDVEILRHCLLAKTITTGKETMDVPLKPTDALAARNGLSKLIYGSLFNWLLSRINDAIAPSQSDKYKSIGVLDIAGFERFDVNSFEQLLINLSNEKLQQHFNHDIIAAELEDYKKEGLVDLQLDFADNTNILILVEGKGGIIDILDEELFVPKGSDAGFVAKVVKAHTKAPSFITPKFSGDPCFGVSHFAGEVTYTASGWLEKNRLSPPKEAFEALSAAKNNVVKQMVKLIITDVKKSTIGGSFKKQLGELMTKIRATQTHYVRCIKPNSLHTPGGIESHEILRQLKCAGIMEAIKIRKSGYSLRITFEDFVERYGILVGIGKPKNQATCSEIIQLAKNKGKISDKDVAMAKTKIMAKEVVRELLDHMRGEAVESLKRPLLIFIETYDQAVHTQSGMFLYPTPLFGSDVDTPAALEKKLRLLNGGLEDVEKKLGSLENPPGWVGGALLVRDAIKKEIEVVTEANAALCLVKPLCCDQTVVKQLESAKQQAEKYHITNGSCEKIGQILDLISEEKDWVVQLQSPETDQKLLLEEIHARKKEYLTPTCHKLVAEIDARLKAKANKQKDEHKAAAAAAVKAKAEVDASKATQNEPENPALLKCNSKTIADTILSQMQPKLPPSKSITSDGNMPSCQKAIIARSISKKHPVITSKDSSKLFSRPKIGMQSKATK